MASEKKILVIDDDLGISEMIQMVMQFNAYDVIISDKPDEAEDMLRTHDIDLLILDMLISGINGTDICKRIRSNSESSISETPILMMSALHKAKKRCLQAGANDFLAKPFEVDELILKVGKLIEN